MNSHPTIAIVGAGAVGSYYGGRLAQHGHNVHFLMRRDYQAVKRGGLSVKSCRGDFRLPTINVYDSPEKMPRADLVIVTLKTTANAEFSRLISPIVHDHTAILTLQNGLGNEEELARIFGAGKIVGGIAFVCINRTDPGEVEHTAEGYVRIAEFIKERPPDRVRAIAEMFNASGIDCEAMPSLRQMRWEKLIWNIPFNGLSTIMDLTTDRILATPEGEALVRKIMAEVVVAAAANGVTITQQFVENNIAKTRGMGAYTTSSHLDRRAGRAIEAETLFGNPVRAARAAGVAVPSMEHLYQMVSMLTQPTSKSQI